ncbi:desmoplakin-like isoform X2 [Kryptolebias marmoratus]|uniref:desmoplakin-like isoform X2 n=1 Tax=Kryptolebias marmoratus TaxID=37003 RepID=UPI0007F92D3F|nr:desmoplakin-like isoform X2 [Kryptolebias marmoratus]
MSMYGSNSRLHTLGQRSSSRPDLTYRNDVFLSGNGYQADMPPMDGGYSNYQTTTFTRSSMHGGGGGGGGGWTKQSFHQAVNVHGVQEKAMFLTGRCQEYLEKANLVLNSGGPPIEAEKFLVLAAESIDKLIFCGRELQEMRIQSDVFKNVEKFQQWLAVTQQKLSGFGTMRVKRVSVGSEGERLYNNALAWITQQKRIIETSPWGEDTNTIDSQITAHNKFHSSLHRSQEVERAKNELMSVGDKYHLTTLDQEWDNLQKMSHARLNQLRDLQNIIDEISQAIMWVNEKEEAELVFDWGDNDIDLYIPKKQESYSKLMRDLEEKEKDLNKLKQKADGLLSNNHPASDKIEAYMDTLQTQWSWLLQITKCIDVHLKENSAYSQFFKDANETYAKLQKQHEAIRNRFVCNKSTTLENLADLLKNLESEKQRIMENKRQVQSLVSKSKSIVRLKPRNPEEKSNNPIMVQALCDFKQDQKGILKGNEGILKDNSQRSKWLVTGPGGLDMLIPSVCLLIPPPNPLSIGLANKNEQYYEAILGVWNQLYINIKSLISWQYCLKDLQYINSLTASMLAKMRPDEYRSIIKRLETHYQEFLRTSQGSEMFGEEERKTIQGQFDKAQQHYDTLIIQLPTYVKGDVVKGEEEVVTTDTSTVIKVTQTPVTQGKPPSQTTSTSDTSTSITSTKASSTSATAASATSTSAPSTSTSSTSVRSTISLTLLSNLQELRRRLEMAESGLTSHLHIPLGENSVHQCTVHIQKMQSVHQDLEALHDDYLSMREMITKQLKGIPSDSEQAKFLRSELEIINQKLGGLQGLYAAYVQRLSALKALLQSLMQAEDIIKVHEARLTERETSSLDPLELENHRSTLKHLKNELEQRRDLLTSMDSELAKAVHWNSQISEPFHKCDVDLSKYSELVNQMGDRWRRIQTQIDNRMWDLDKQKNHLTQYQQNKTSTENWIDNARKRQDNLQMVKINDVQMLMDHLSQQKVLNNEIKGKKEKVETVQKNADTCAASIKDYELQLASYSSGLETLLNVPIKKTVLQSPATVVRQEAADVQAHYIELLTRSSDYYKFLGELLKNMEELKLRNTRIEMLEEELRRLKDDLKDRNLKNKSLEDALARYKLELSQSKDELITMEEVKRTTAMQVNAAKENLGTTQSQIQDLNDQLTRLKYQLDEEKRKRRLAEERYNSQQEEYEAAVRRRQKELEEVNWVKIDLEKVVKDKEREIERLKQQLEEEAARRRNAESDISKVRTQCTQEINQLKQTYESEIHVTKTTILKASQQKEKDTADLKLQVEKLTAEKRKLEEELRRLSQSIAHIEGQKNKAEQEISQQRASVTQETRIRSELEVQLRTLKQQREETELKLKEANKNNQEKSRQISLLTFNLEEEGKKRRALELEINHLKQTSMMVHESQSQYKELLLQRDSLQSKLKLMEQDKNSLQRLEDELARIKLTLETEIRNKQRLQDEKNAIAKEFNSMKTHFELKETQIRQCESDRDKADRDRMSLKNEIERLMRELKSVEERYRSRLLSSEQEVSDLALKRESLEKEIQRLKQRPTTSCRQTQTDEKVSTIDPSKLVFDGVRRKVTAHQLCDCGIISKATLDELLRGKKTVDEVAVGIQLSLKGTGIIAGMTTGSQGKMPFTEAKHKNLLSPESAIMLLEAQAATGYIMDPAFNDRMPVDAACSRGIVDTEDRDVLLKAEAASTGFKDPYTGKVLSVGQPYKQGHVDKETTIRLLQAQESVGGILDPVLSVFLPKDLALDHNLIDEDLYRSLNNKPTCYLDPASEEKITYSDLRRKCTVEPVSGLLLLRGPEKPMTVKGICGEVSVSELIKSELLDETDLQKLNQGKLSCKDIEDKLKPYLFGSTCIAGIYDEAKDRILPFYRAMSDGLLMRGTTLELLEAQAASGFIVDPINNVFLTVEEASKRGLIGKEFKNKLLSAEKAVTGYKDPSTGKIISLFQAIEKELVEKGHGIRLLEAQIASGGIIDPVESHRIDVSVAYKRGYFDEEMNEILSYEGDDTKGFFDPNTKENLTYLQLKERCITDPKTGLILLPLKDKNKPKKSQETRTNVLRKRRVVIVDPDTGLEMSVREAYHKGLIDYETFLDLSEQECEWEEITIKGSDGSSRLVIVDRKTGTQYDIQDCLDKNIINQKSLDQYRAGTLTLTELADQITSRTNCSEMTIAASNIDDMITCSSPTQATPSSPTVRKRFNSISITVSPPGMLDDQSPVAAIFDTETLEKITIDEGLRRGIVDTITAQRLLEAQACTGGIINPATGERLLLEDAVHQSIIDEGMAAKLKPAQKAYIGFEDLKTKRKLSAAEAVKETWLPYEAGQRFLEFQYLTGGLIEPSTGRCITIEEAIRKGWLNGQTAQKLQDTHNHKKNLTCPKTKLKISYKEAMDGCMVEDSNNMKLLQASSVSSKGISSPYNVSNPGSRSGSRVGSKSGSRRGSVDYSSTFSYSFSSSSTTHSSNIHS